VRIVGGRPLGGSVEIGGSKNAALPILAASILTDERVLLHSVPRLDDVHLMLSILKKLGGDVTLEGNSATVRMGCVSAVPDFSAVCRMRASICLLGPLVARCGEAVLPLPGGCAIGPRPIDLHLKGLQKLGCEVIQSKEGVRLRAKRLNGARIFLAGKNGGTVTGTANMLCAAAIARGTTEIHFAACEPEVVDLCKFLTGMGAKIYGIGSPILTVDGVDSLRGAEHRLIADRIQAGTFALLAPMLRGDMAIKRAPISHCAALLDVLERIGVPFSADGDCLHIFGGKCDRLAAIDVSAMAYPGFPTDLQAALCALATQCCGESAIGERIYENRFGHLVGLRSMGAGITLAGSTARVVGPTKLAAAELSVADLRGGACLCMAALAASGESIVDSVHHMDRGYEQFEEKLRSIGADIMRFER
jgi:UDP-N-acetylglucosamine 1-carboxyvinyltransferase